MSESSPASLPAPAAVSVILPVYNAQATLGDAIESILCQTFSDFELIAVDDGSTDRSLLILREFEERDTRVHIITRPNTGIAGALNDGISQARGGFLARMDADDISLPTRFEKQVAYLSEHPDCALVGSRVLLIEPFGSALYESDHDVEHDKIEATLLSGVGWAVVHPTAMMRTDAVRGVGGYRADRVPIEDLDLFLRLAEAHQLANLPAVLLHYRQHLQSSNRTRFAEQEEKKWACIADAYQRRGTQLPANWAPPPRQQLSAEAELMQWAWAALKRKNLAAARRHAWAVVRLRPFARQSWNLLYCTIRGR